LYQVSSLTEDNTTICEISTTAQWQRGNSGGATVGKSKNKMPLRYLKEWGKIEYNRNNELYLNTMGHRFRSLSLFAIILLPTITTAQVLVKDEPRHKPVFQNDKVRVLDVRIEPGDTTLFHIHQIPSAFIALSNTLVGSQVYKEKIYEDKNKVGIVWYNEFSEPLIHRVWNRDSARFQVMDIEILTSDDDLSPKVITPSNLSLVKDERKVRIYEFQLNKSDRIKLKQLESPILIFPTKGKIQINSLSEIDRGKFQFLDKGKNVIIKNIDSKETTGIIFQIK